jgi:hypothetical protein
VPRYDLKWDPENDKNEWSRNYFIHCILEDLRRAKVKPLNYSQVTAVQQGPVETPQHSYRDLRMLYKNIPTLYQSHRKMKLS